jgi:gas vesicle protein
MNTTAKTILGITVATATGAALGMLLAPEKGSILLAKIRSGTKRFLNDFSARTSKPDVDHPMGEMTSELIDMDQYETYTSKRTITSH